MTLLDASEKVADFLLEFTDHPHPSLTIKQDCLPYSHEEIEEFTGLQRQTVTKILNQFQNEKMLYEWHILNFVVMIYSVIFPHFKKSLT